MERTTLRQWLRLSSEKFKAQKVDCSFPNARADDVLPLLAEAEHLGLRLSLRCTGATSPEILPELAAAGLLDVALAPSDLTVSHLRPWVETTEKAGLPLRLFLNARELPEDLSPDLKQLLAHVASVRVELSETPSAGMASLDPVVTLLEALREVGTEGHCLQIPFCQLPESCWSMVSNGAQQLAHHQHYRPAAEAFARQMALLSPSRVHQAVELSLGRGATFHHRIDDAVLPWILKQPWYFFWLWFLHKLTRRLPIRRPAASPLPEEQSALEAQLQAHEEQARANRGPVCDACRLHPICDHLTEPFKQAFPGRAPRAVVGEPCYDARAFFEPTQTWYDVVDDARLHLGTRRDALVAEAHHRLAAETPTREIPAESYEIEGHATHRMPASIRWFSFSTAELRSTVLARVTPPFTLSVTVGGGIADHMGFAFGRHTRLVCSMTAFSHKLTLHVDRDGYYVLLRDGELVLPLAIQEGEAVPERLGSVVEPRIALGNIDGQIVTQTVLLWETQAESEHPPCAHSVVIVCTRYARRLQAALLALAHQQGLDDGALEIIVGYVPGIDATDDVLDSLERSYPFLRIVRMPFGGSHQRAKGFIINECLDVARGAWITLLDADIMLPPDYFERLASQSEDATFVVPDGRHMLSAETTAAVLLGLERPWESYDALLESAGEYRHHESEGVPPGFCQSVRRTVFEAIRYQELDHFEGSDWWFSAQVIEQFGKETRLAGLRVLHLDHGGSQWYGTEKQF